MSNKKKFRKVEKKTNRFGKFKRFVAGGLAGLLFLAVLAFPIKAKADSFYKNGQNYIDEAGWWGPFGAVVPFDDQIAINTNMQPNVISIVTEPLGNIDDTIKIDSVFHEVRYGIIQDFPEIDKLVMTTINITDNMVISYDTMEFTSSPDWAWATRNEYITDPKIIDGSKLAISHIGNSQMNIEGTRREIFYSVIGGIKESSKNLEKIMKIGFGGNLYFNLNPEIKNPELSIYDVSGKEVYSGIVKEKSLINVGNLLTPGVYFSRLTYKTKDEKRSESGKLIILE